MHLSDTGVIALGAVFGYMYAKIERSVPIPPIFAFPIIISLVFWK